jgi:hypothetical protein
VNWGCLRSQGRDGQAVFRALRHSFLWPALVWLYAAIAVGQSTPLGEAEAALQSVQFDRAREAAHRAVHAGGLDTKQLARAYEIIGLCAASVGSNAEAHAAYLRLLALAPETRPSEMLPPEKNRPFYEAQGFWLARRERLGLTLDIDVATRRVKVQLSDPLGMGEKLVYEEPGDTATRVVHPLPSSGSTVELEVPPRPGAVSFVVDLVDAHSSVVARAEGKLEPPPPAAGKDCKGPCLDASKPPPPPAVVGIEPPPAEKSERRAAWVRSPWLWTAVGVVVVGGAVTTAVLLRNRDPELRTDISIAR